MNDLKIDALEKFIGNVDAESQKLHKELEKIDDLIKGLKIELTGLASIIKSIQEDNIPF